VPETQPSEGGVPGSGAPTNPPIEDRPNNETPAPPPTTIDPWLLDFPTVCPSSPDPQWDIVNGVDAGRAVQAYACANLQPLVAEGEPITIGVMTPEGDPAGNFPEFAVGINAAIRYVNEELGGIGANFSNRSAGRPVTTVKCTMQISPSDSTRCANELAAIDPTVVFSTLNFFGNHLSILRSAGIPVVVGLPISPADITSDGVFTLTSNCTVFGTAATSLAASLVSVGRVSTIWANTPPGVFCHHDGTKKALNIRIGSTSGPSPYFGSSPNLLYSGTPMRPGIADPASTLQAVIDSDPEAIIVDMQRSDCSIAIQFLLDNGVDPSTTPLILNASCGDARDLASFGSRIVGVYVVGQFLRDEPITTNQLLTAERDLLAEKINSYGDPTFSEAFQDLGFATMMRLYRVLDHASRAEDMSRQAVLNTLESIDGLHSFRNPPISCPKAPSPYVSMCANSTRIFRWTGSVLEAVNEIVMPLDVLAGTSLDFGR
jgi:branched-chain amino acid transport system substrate-binding protein